MPTALIYGPNRFAFFAYDCDEPRHVHVTRDKSRAKFWLDPVELANNKGFSQKDLNEIERIIQDNLDDLRRKWDDFCAATGTD
jgi:hypothetical protein